jgi:hypothetical protein
MLINVPIALRFAVVQDICKTLLVCTVTRLPEGFDSASSSTDGARARNVDSSSSNSYAVWHSNNVVVTELAVNTARTARGKGEHSIINTVNTVNITNSSRSSCNLQSASSTSTSTVKAAAETSRSMQKQTKE